MDKHFLFFVMIGFGAQLIDGALGMAYGVISMASLLLFGVSPAISSAAVHIAEIFTTGVSGLSHAMFKNINRDLLIRIAIPGVFGAIIGAYFLTKVPSTIIKPCITFYLFIMGSYIIFKAIRNTFMPPSPTLSRKLIPIGLAGGFLDAAGGGGWGPIVTTSLVALGFQPRFAIGSTNLAEFLVTLSASATFMSTIGFPPLKIIIGLLVGGVIAAPIAAYVTRIIPSRIFMFLVGSLIIILSIYNGATIYLDSL